MLVLFRQSVRKLFKKATGGLPKEVPLESISSVRGNDADGNATELLNDFFVLQYNMSIRVTSDTTRT